MRTTHNLLVSAAIVLATPGLGVAAASTKDELTFEVSLDDKPIGMHRFRISDGGPMRVVESDASFDVRILRVPVYRYRHRNTETWQNGCLKRIDAETDANGTPYAVDLRKTAAGYTIVTPSETSTHEVDCLMSFAYWDRRFLQEKRLLNTQTGELIAVEVQSLGESKREIANRTLSVEGFRLLAKPQNIDIKVFYHSADGRWVALESVLENGRRLRYVPAAKDLLALGERISDNPVIVR
jgi:hypothetical protein